MSRDYGSFDESVPVWELVLYAVKRRWRAATWWARFNDSRRGAGLYANRCQLPAKHIWMPKHRRLLFWLRGRTICGAYAGGDHWRHTYHPGQWRSVNPVPMYYDARLYLRADRDPQARLRATQARFAAEKAALDAVLAQVNGGFRDS